MPAWWLEPGKAAVAMTLDDEQVAVDGGPLHGHYHFYRDKAQGEKHLIIVYGDERDESKQQVFHMKHVGGNVYRTNTQSQILVFQNTDMNIPGPELQDHDVDMQSDIPIPDFDCVMNFTYMHPGSPEVTLRLGCDRKNGDQKVSWRGNTPTGYWSYNDPKHMGPLPSGIDATSPIWCIRFNCKGDETAETGTVYGLVSETSHVYRAIGSVNKEQGVRFYDDADISICTRWHIVMMSKEKPHLAQ